MCKNTLSSPTSLIDSFTYTEDYGSMIKIESNNWAWNDILEGSYHEFSIEFKDQNFNPMYIKDANNVILLVLDIPE